MDDVIKKQKLTDEQKSLFLNQIDWKEITK